MNRIGFIVASLLLVLAIGSSMLFVVDQRQFGVVYSLNGVYDLIEALGHGVDFSARRQSLR